MAKFHISFEKIVHLRFAHLKYTFFTIFMRYNLHRQIKFTITRYFKDTMKAYFCYCHTLF